MNSANKKCVCMCLTFFLSFFFLATRKRKLKMRRRKEKLLLGSKWERRSHFQKRKLLKLSSITFYLLSESWVFAQQGFSFHFTFTNFHELQTRCEEKRGKSRENDPETTNTHFTISMIVKKKWIWHKSFSSNVSDFSPCRRARLEVARRNFVSH